MINYETIRKKIMGTILQIMYQTLLTMQQYTAHFGVE